MKQQKTNRNILTHTLCTIRNYKNNIWGICAETSIYLNSYAAAKKQHGHLSALSGIRIRNEISRNSHVIS